MKWHLWGIGKPSLSYAKEGISLYSKRFQGFAFLEVHFVKSEEDFLKKSDGFLKVGLDERGEEINSQELAKKIDLWEQKNVKAVSLFIGEANGLSEEFKKQCDWLWSLGRLTLQHELATVVVLEQLYRAYAIKANHPYHRD